MSRGRNKNTKPELAVRKLAHALGFRFRLHRRDLPGSPDIVFPGRKKIIFVHGCFWHRHQNCHYAYTPKTNKAFWSKKFATNQQRDRNAIRALGELNWQILIIWECEASNAETLTQKLQDFLKD